RGAQLSGGGEIFHDLGRQRAHGASFAGGSLGGCRESGGDQDGGSTDGPVHIIPSARGISGFVISRLSALGLGLRDRETRAPAPVHSLPSARRPVRPSTRRAAGIPPHSAPPRSRARRRGRE